MTPFEMAQGWRIFRGPAAELTARDAAAIAAMAGMLAGQWGDRLSDPSDFASYHDLAEESVLAAEALLLRLAKEPKGGAA